MSRRKERKERMYLITSRFLFADKYGDVEIYNSRASRLFNEITILFSQSNYDWGWYAVDSEYPFRNEDESFNIERLKKRDPKDFVVAIQSIKNYINDENANYVILGGPDIIPFYELTINGENVYSDYQYSRKQNKTTINEDDVEEVIKMIAENNVCCDSFTRIPDLQFDNKSMSNEELDKCCEYYLQIIKNCIDDNILITKNEMIDGGKCIVDKKWKNAADVMNKDMNMKIYETPPEYFTSKEVYPTTDNDAQRFYSMAPAQLAMLHGTSLPVNLFSNNECKIALDTEGGLPLLKKGMIAMYDCCYGAKMFNSSETINKKSYLKSYDKWPISNSYLYLGGKSFLGPVNSISVPGINGNKISCPADVICEKFYNYVCKGYTIGDALALARQSALDGKYVTMVGLSDYISMVLYGASGSVGIKDGDVTVESKNIEYSKEYEKLAYSKLVTKYKVTNDLKMTLKKEVDRNDECEMFVYRIATTEEHAKLLDDEGTEMMEFVLKYHDKNYHVITKNNKVVGTRIIEHNDIKY